MARYTSAYNGTALSTSNDTRTLVTTATAAGSVLRVSCWDVGGEATSQAVNRVVLNRPGTNGITPTNTVPEKIDPASPAASFTNASGWSTQPVLSANDVLDIAFNAFGGRFTFFTPPDAEIIVGGQGAVANLSMRSRSGTSTVSGFLIVEER